MNTNLLASEVQRIGYVICQDIREFEQKNGMRVTGIKIKRDGMGEIEKVTAKVEFPE